MTIRNLDALFRPSAIALVGASNQAGSVGAVLARNLLEAGFRGPILSVNPHETAIRSTLNYKSIDALPVTPDLAVVATPPGSVPQVIADLGRRGCRAAIVITAGFENGREESRLLRERMLMAARPSLLRILGPNCLGFISPARGINASFARSMPAEGSMALVSQSGAIAAAMLDWAGARHVGFSHLASIGDAADIDFGDMLDYLALDPSTKAIMLYVEQVGDARKFMSAGRVAARTKPVIVIKAGRSAAGAQAALSHTGALAGASAVYEAAFRRAGIVQVDGVADLFAAASVLSAGLDVKGERLTIVTNGGGLGVLAADAAEATGLDLPRISASNRARLDSVLPPTWSGGNPIDVLGDADSRRYSAVLDIILADPGQDAVLVMNCPTGVTDSAEAARGVVSAHARQRSASVFACWTDSGSGAASGRVFAAAGIPCFSTPEDAVQAFSHLVRHRKLQELLLEAPSAATSVSPDLDAIRTIIAAAMAEERDLLSEVESKALLKAAGICVVETVVAVDPADAALKAQALGGEVALKILSPDITHKSDIGGVRLALNVREVEEAANQMLRKVQETAPKARITGFTVQAMVRRPLAQETICGIQRDPTFGPVVLFGHGGVAVEVVADRVLGLPPLNSVLARDMIARTRVARLLSGFRDRPAADLDAVATVLVQLSRIAVAVPEIVELDINPLICDQSGAIALDARVRVAQRTPTGKPAISPYPDELAGSASTRDGLPLSIRPVLPEDARLLIDLLDRTSSAAIRPRFLGVVETSQAVMAARLSQIDYDREMALVVFDASHPGGGLVGVAWLMCDPERERGQFALMVRTDRHGEGIGYGLMQRLLSYAAKTGLKRLQADIPAENGVMLQLVRELGFDVEVGQADSSLVRVSRAVEGGG